MLFSKLSAAALIAAVVVSTAGVASAAPVNGLAIKNAAPSNVETVQFRRWGPALGAGIVAGAIVGGMLANPYYGYGPYYGPGPYYAGPGPYYPAPYVAGPVVRPGPVYSDAVAYCMRRYRSYDPRSGTFLGYDGLRHPCP
jgi:BA14K-like protein